MRLKLFGIFLAILIIGGCGTTKYRTAEKHLERREYDSAIRSYLKLLDPHVRDGKRYIYYDKEAITGIGLVYWHMQRFETGAKILNMVVQKEPSYGRAVFHLGMCYEGAGLEDEAIQVYKKYPIVPPSDPYRKILIGRLDWAVRRKITREIQHALLNESQLDVASIPEKSVAVLYFLSLSEDPQWLPLQKGLAEMIVTDLSQIEDLKVIERIRLTKLMEELRLGPSGVIEETNAPRMGKLMGARNLVKGSYMVMPDLKMSMDAGIFEPERIFLPSTVNFEGSLARLFRMEKELVLRILDYFEIELTPRQRERILRIPTENMMAFMNYCQGLDALDQDNFRAAQEYFHQASLMDGGFQEAKDLVMPANLWEATHNRNLIRVHNDVAELIRNTPIGGAEIVYTPPQSLTSTWDRLQWMGIFQNTGFLPGNETREPFQEADLMGAPVLPQILGDPPSPPGGNN